MVIIGALVLVGVVLGHIHFEENFDNDSWKNRWITSTYHGRQFGTFERTNGVYYGGPNAGLETMENFKNYALSTKFTPFNIANKTLVLQFSVKRQQSFSCGRGYLRLYDCNFNPSDTHQGTPYILMFGPYLCQYLELRVNIFGGQRLQSEIKWEENQDMHVHTLILESDMTYQVLIDGEKVSSDRIIQVMRGNETIGSRKDIAMSPPIFGIGFVFYQLFKGTIFDNILLSDDVHVADRKRQEIFHDMWVRLRRMRFAVDARLERLRTPWLVDIAPEDLTRIFDSDETITFNDNNHTNFFLVDFDKFLVPFNWSSNNTAIKAVAEYNKHHSRYNESIQLWISFQPQAQDISNDIDSVLEIVNEANCMVAGTVTVIVINYGFLELDRQTMPFVNHEIRRVKNKLKSLPLPVPQLALQIADTNCKHIQSVRYLEINLLDWLLLMPMPPGKKFPARSELDLSKTLFICRRTAELLNIAALAVLHTHASIEIDYEAGVYKYEMGHENSILTGSRLQIIHAADKMGGKNIVDIKHGPNGNNLVNWLYQSSGFSKSHFGAVISWADNELLGSEYFPFALFDSFRQILIHASTSKHSGNDDRLTTIVHGIANYSLVRKRLGRKGDYSFRSLEDNVHIETAILVTIDTTDFEVIKQQVDNTILTALKANEISPRTVTAIFFDWMTCSRTKICCGYNKNISQATCFKVKRHYDFFASIKEYVLETVKKTRGNTITMLRVGSVFDKQFWDDQVEWRHKGCKAAWDIVEHNDVILCKSTLRHQDVVKYGGLLASKFATEDFSICTAFGIQEPQPFYFYVNVVGCGGGHSNMTLLVEYARLMEYLNGWAQRENVILFTNAGEEVPANCSENVEIAEEAGCSCGWWIKQESQNKFQDKKTVARQLYEKQNADKVRPEAVVSTESLLWLWVLIPVIVLGALITIPAPFLVLHYRSKYILTKRDVEDFIKGCQTPRAVEGEEAAETQAYNGDKYELCPSVFTIDITSSCLGSGEFGQVYPGSIRRDGEISDAAVKRTNTNLIGKSHGYYMALKGLLSEIKVLAYVGEHKHIVSLLGAYTKKLRKGEIAVFLELCPLGSLDKYLHSIKPQMIHDYVSITSDPDDWLTDEEENESGKVQVLDKESSDELFRWAGEIAIGMEFLASKKLVHADLATRNVLLTAHKVVKICDFGLSRRLYDYTEYVKQNQEPLPWRWMAPESLRRLVFNEKTDIWAYGVTLWEMFTLGDQPYPGLTWTANFPVLLERGLRLPEPPFNLQQIYSIMLQCWDISPASRPTFSQVISELDPGK